MNDEDGLKTIELSIDGMHCERCVHTVKAALSEADGIDSFEVVVGKADVRFLPQLVSATHIENLIEGSGYSIQKKATRKGPIGRFIDRMIESNEKNFGSERLDCCNLSSNDTSRVKP